MGSLVGAVLPQAPDQPGHCNAAQRRVRGTGVLDRAVEPLGPEHPTVGKRLNNLAALLQDTNRLTEAEPLMRRALAVVEQAYGAEDPTVAIHLNNLSLLLLATNRLAEAESLSSRHVAILVAFREATGHEHPHMQAALANHLAILTTMGLPESEARASIQAKLRQCGD